MRWPHARQDFAGYGANGSEGLARRFAGFVVAADDKALSARVGFSGLFGKLDDEPVNGLRLPTVIVEAAKERASQAGLPYQEFLREVITIGVMGRNEVERKFARRLDAIEGKVEET